MWPFKKSAPTAQQLSSRLEVLTEPDAANDSRPVTLSQRLADLSSEAAPQSHTSALVGGFPAKTAHVGSKISLNASADVPAANKPNILAEPEPEADWTTDLSMQHLWQQTLTPVTPVPEASLPPVADPTTFNVAHTTLLPALPPSQPPEAALLPEAASNTLAALLAEAQHALADEPILEEGEEPAALAAPSPLTLLVTDTEDDDDEDRPALYQTSAIFSDETNTDDDDWLPTLSSSIAIDTLGPLGTSSSPLALVDDTPPFCTADVSQDTEDVLIKMGHHEWLSSEEPEGNMEDLEETLEDVFISPEPKVDFASLSHLETSFPEPSPRPETSEATPLSLPEEPRLSWEITSRNFDFPSSDSPSPVEVLATGTLAASITLSAEQPVQMSLPADNHLASPSPLSDEARPADSYARDDVQDAPPHPLSSAPEIAFISLSSSASEPQNGPGLEATTPATTWPTTTSAVALSAVEESLSQNITRIRQQYLLEESRRVREQINQLVSGYLSS
jgi:hypothetical protein